MSQMDCLHWLQDQKEKNPNRWFRVKDVQEGLRQKGKGDGTLRNVGKHLLILTQWDDLRMRGVGFWEHYKEFKAK